MTTQHDTRLRLILAGHSVDPASVLKTFEDGACEEMVIAQNIEKSRESKMKCYLAGNTEPPPRERQLLKLFRHRLVSFFFCQPGELHFRCWKVDVEVLRKRGKA